MEKKFAFQNKIEEVTRLVSFIRKRKNIELEARLGFLDSRKFNSNVKKDFFNSCLEMCESYDGWKNIKDWHSRRDFFLENNVRVSVFSEPVHRKISIRKKKLKTLTFPINFKDSNKINIPAEITGANKFEYSLPNALRIDASVEEITTGEIKDQVPNFVRYKLIKQFKTKSGWSFDFSKTFTHHDPQIVIDMSTIFNQDDLKDNASYEVEVELEDFDYLTKQSDINVATSLMLKVFDFLPHTAFV